MANKTTKTDLFKIDPRNIEVVENFNSRIDFGDIQELAEQIAKDGVLNPIHVKRISGTDKFTLVDGERRYRAVMYNLEHGLPVTMIPAIVVPQSTSEEDLLRMQLQCNEGKNFSDYEYAVHLKKLRDHGMSNQQIADLLGKKVSRISWYFRFLNLDERVRDLMKERRITGVDVYHVLQAYKDEDKATEVILTMKEMADQNGEHKISLKKSMDNIDEFVKEKQAKAKKKTVLSDNDFNKTIVNMDTVAIKNGLNKLYAYLEKYPADSTQGLSILQIMDKLKEGMLITEAIEELISLKKVG